MIIVIIYIHIDIKLLIVDSYLIIRKRKVLNWIEIYYYFVAIAVRSFFVM